MTKENISQVRVSVSEEFRNLPWVQYIASVLLNIVGVRVTFTDEAEKANIYYGDRLPTGFEGLYIPSNRLHEVHHHDDLKFQRNLDATISFSQDVFLYCFKCLSGEFEPQKDDVGVPISNTATPSEKFVLENPVLNMVAVQISDALRILDPTLSVLPLWPENKRLAIVFTHDVDAPFSCIKFPFRLRLLARSLRDREIISSFRVLIGMFKRMMELVLFPQYGGNQDPQFGFGYWVSVERTIGARPTFFLATKSSSEKGADYRDVTYDYNDRIIVDELIKATRDGAEIGLHGSINSKLSSLVVNDEFDRLQSILHGVKVSSVRNHFWSIGSDAESTLEEHQRVGFEVDSTFGLNDAPGFRRGICVPFRVWNRYTERPLDILSIPNTCMDGGIFYSEKCVDTGVQILKDHVALVRRYSGAAVLNWHLEQSNLTRLNGAGEALTRFITTMTQEEQDEIFFGTMAEINTWWRKRAAVLEGVQ